MTRFWTNPSVRALAGDRDPEEAIIERARDLALDALSSGWSGPPFDPIELADRAGIEVIAKDDLYDARTVPIGSGDHVRIEYNPSRPRGRVRYSVAHELAHTFFPDVADEVRHRIDREEMRGDVWQLEMLCNLAAAELLMPTGTFPELGDTELDIDHLMALQKKFEVSTEALLLRVAKLTKAQIAVFAGSRIEDQANAAIRLEYLRESRTWSPTARRGMSLPATTALKACTAVGYTARGDETWPHVGDVHVEGVGIPPYPGQRLPRVVGFVRPRKAVPVTDVPPIEYVVGDALETRGSGPRLIAHVVNDRTANWGGMFARAVAAEFPSAQDDFRNWVTADRSNLRLGRVRVTDVGNEISVGTMIAQRGYGPSKGRRLEYHALRDCLRQVADAASSMDASVHMPRIGAGQAGGDWSVIAELIDAELSRQGVRVTVYSLPGENWPQAAGQVELVLTDSNV